jgi:hypothetical protein
LQLLEVIAADADDKLKRRLELRMGVPDVGRPDLYPVVQILIDGEEVLATAGAPPRVYIGSPPAAILGDDAPLLPARPARQIALYVDTSGDPGAGCIAPVISAHDDVVVWSDFRIFMDVDQAPVIEQGPLTQSWTIDVPDLMFDAGQYTTEVQRASAAREWESDRWRTALILDDYLSSDPLALGNSRELGWVEPEEESTGRFSITILDETLESGLVVSLVPTSGTPQERARKMADFLMNTPEQQWPVQRRIHLDTK